MCERSPINVSSLILLCNLFNFFLAGAKSSLFPFLTIFYRLMGLTASQTGYLMAAKTLVTFLFAPVWAKCAAKWRKRRTVLMFSIFMMGITYLLLSLILVFTKSGLFRCDLNFSSTDEHGFNRSRVTEVSTTSLNASTPVLALAKPTSAGIPGVNTSVGFNTRTIKTFTFNSSGTTTSFVAKQDTLKHFQTLKLPVRNHQSKWTAKDMWLKFKIKLMDWAHSLREKQLELFFTMLAIVTVGEIFAAPVEKIADDSWYDLLDDLDDLEKYGKQRIWCSFAYLIFPLLTAIIVDSSQCVLGFSTNHILIHFYVFGALLVIVFIIAWFYPIPAIRRTFKIANRLKRGLKVACLGYRGFMYIITVFLMGFMYSAIANYLFWVIQDLGGIETAMSLCIFISTLSEIPMLICGDRLMKKFKSAGIVAIALFCLSARMTYYSFVKNPWVVLPAELLHAFTHTAMWYAVLSNPAFNLSSDISRSIRSILSSAYFGVGFSLGSVASGLIWDYLGVALLWRIYAGISIIWCFVFLLLNRCAPKDSGVKYKKLLQAEPNGNNSDDSSNLEADWLEQALKES